MFKRIHLIVMDSVGIGEAPDAAEFGDVGAHTLGNIAKHRKLNIPNLEKLGLGSIEDLKNILPENHKMGYVKKLQECSAGKDTMTGHWEMAGLYIDKPFRVFLNGFPEELINKLKVFSGREILCNLPYSGTTVLDDYGEEQMKTGALIVYTSADSVLQIAAHEEIIPLKELYEICEYARKITLDEPYMLGRIIARPYIGKLGAFKRTANRHDYALSPFSETVLDGLKNTGKTVWAVGKINDIFNTQGITQSVRTISDMDGVDKLLQVMKEDFEGISFTNLVDFDALYGHRRDVEGYAKALEEFDARLPEIIETMQEDDLLLITADHGTDPSFRGTDHTREFVPLLIYAPKLEGAKTLEQGYFYDIAATIADNFGITSPNGTSFLKKLQF